MLICKLETGSTGVAMRRMLTLMVILAPLVAAGIYTAGIAFDWYGKLEPAGDIHWRASPTVTQGNLATSKRALVTTDRPSKQILFGDLHVHTTFSSDAFRMSLPMVQGDGAHPPADACDFARACSALDFWALTDHAESHTPARWQESIASVQQCNALAGDPDDPDMVTFMGFEWTQSGAVPEEHYGHKNVIFRDTSADQLPTRPIGSSFRTAFGSIPLKLRILPPLRDFTQRQAYYDFSHLISAIAEVPACPPNVPVRELPADCAETATTPAELFSKLDEWGFASLVIPHGTSWGVYTPAGASFDKQLLGNMHDPQRQKLIEIFSGHGNSEEFRTWSAVETDSQGNLVCPEPSADYLPSCWRAGEIVLKRCIDAGFPAEDCEQRAQQARDEYLRYGNVGWHSIPGTELPDWLDAGQCRDCFLPTFNHRPKVSAQYGLAIRNFENPENPIGFRFGFVGSSDNHTARPGTGYKEYARNPMVDWWGYQNESDRELYSTNRGAPAPNSVSVDPSKIDTFNILELERQASFFVTGGLAAVHSTGRSRAEIWAALNRKEVFATSGERMLLWFDLLNPSPKDNKQTAPMGAEVKMTRTPSFRAKAMGAFEQKPGCPSESLNALSPNRLELLCRGECYNPGDIRKKIVRIEIVRIRPQANAGQNVAPLIQDPWKTFSCEGSDDLCRVEFSDPEFSRAQRDTVYYARAIQAPQPIINAGGLRCEVDEQGQCLTVNPCYGDDRTELTDLCLEEEYHRAWSSPIFVDFGGD